MARAMRKQIVYVSYIPVKKIESPEKITLDHTEYYWLTSLLMEKIVERNKDGDSAEYLEALLKKLIPYQIGNRHVELRLGE